VGRGMSQPTNTEARHHGSVHRHHRAHHRMRGTLGTDRDGGDNCPPPTDPSRRSGRLRCSVWSCLRIDPCALKGLLRLRRVGVRLLQRILKDCTVLKNLGRSEKALETKVSSPGGPFVAVETM